MVPILYGHQYIGTIKNRHNHQDVKNVLTATLPLVLFLPILIKEITDKWMNVLMREVIVL